MLNTFKGQSGGAAWYKCNDKIRIIAIQAYSFSSVDEGNIATRLSLRKLNLLKAIIENNISNEQFYKYNCDDNEFHLKKDLAEYKKDSDAQFWLGNYYVKLKPTTYDNQVIALGWYNKALYNRTSSEELKIEIYYELGNLHSIGEAPIRDIKAAIENYKKAGKKNHSKSLETLARIYTEDSDKQNSTKAQKYRKLYENCMTDRERI